MTDSRDVERWHRSVDAIKRAAISTLDRLWARMNTDDPRVAARMLAQVMPGLQAKFGQLGAAAAMEWYESLRPDGLPSYTPTPAPLPPPRAAEETTQWAASTGLLKGAPEVTYRALQGAVARWVHQAAQETIAHNIDRDPARVRWARVPRGAYTCAFCTMLASRGWVYASKEKAGGSTRFHDHCDCAIVPSWKREDPRLSGYDPDRLYRLYERGVANAESGDTKGILAGMRRADPEAYTDGIKPNLLDARPPSRDFMRHSPADLTKAQKDALKLWTAPYLYTQIQQALRTGTADDVPSDLIEDFANIDAAVKAHSLPRDMRFFRVEKDLKSFGDVDLSRAGKLVGVATQWSGFTAVTYPGNKTIEGWGGKVRMTVLAPKGTRGLPIADLSMMGTGEGEVLLDRDLMIKVAEARYDSGEGRAYLTIEVMGHG